MVPLTPATLRGVWGTALLPLDSANRIDVARLRQELDVLTAAGLDGIYAHGTAGEFHELSEDEYDLVNGLVADHATRAGIPFQLGASHMSARLSLDRIRRAVRHRPAAIQVILPDWAPLQAVEAGDALAGMAAAAGDVPLVLYNPPHAKTQLDAAAFVQLAEAVPQIVGIKVAGGDAGWYQAMRSVTGRLAVFVSGHTLATGLGHGAAGSYSNIACLSPRGAAEWYAMMRADPARALDVERRLQRFLAEHIGPLQQRGYAGAALDKTLAHIGGWADVGTQVRWPYRGVPEAEAEALRSAARAAVPELVPAVPRLTGQRPPSWRRRCPEAGQFRGVLTGSQRADLGGRPSRIGVTENQRARHDAVSARRREGRHRVYPDAAVHDYCRSRGAVPRRGQLTYPAGGRGVKIAALDPDLRAQQQHPVDAAEVIDGMAHRFMSLQAERSLAAAVPNARERRIQVGAGRALHGQHVGARLGEPIDPVVGIGHVEMDVKGVGRALAQRGDQFGAEEQIADVVSVEDIHVEAVHDVIEQVDGLAQRQLVGRPQ